MSVALLEAMACGLAPVVTAIPGNTDVVTPERNGLLAKAGDEEALAAALARVLSDAPLREQLAASAIETVHAHFSLEHMNEHYAALYRRLAQSDSEQRANGRKAARS